MECSVERAHLSESQARRRARGASALLDGLRHYASANLLVTGEDFWLSSAREACPRPWRQFVQGLPPGATPSRRGSFGSRWRSCYPASCRRRWALALAVLAPVELPTQDYRGGGGSRLYLSSIGGMAGTVLDGSRLS